MANPTAQQCHAMIGYFIKAYEAETGRPPLINRNKAKPGFAGMLMDYTPTQAKELVDYYIEHWDSPTIQWFIYNYEHVDAAMQEDIRQKVVAAKRRKETEQRLIEWRQRWKS